ncbi:Shedu anti-phage system protein SduA domain-containing protein [Costertonia aggregata]|uniref:DUF4263 domain-containing protein n=1 Tax=Costertonia aggregata TaxID=343403 RepID=A0A7H9AU68_9FLAO|nr:Shedu anti-phage system protein SduA domain-containing protein [Costertonia aggregata]QLG47041.1 DUF4263 domain-containing protein [Costertonia aggregata]
MYVDNWFNILNSSHFKENLILDWESLLNKDLTENHYQTYLSNNAGFFMANENCHVVISKLKLGSELETDFVTLSDGFSNGNKFELFEIKRPRAKLFNSRGIMTSDFNRATQQIRDWKRWLIDNPSWFKKYLPTISTRVITDSHLRFKIIIGRRTNNPYEIEKRNQISKEIGAEIRSFDYLTDKLKSKQFYRFTWLPDENEDYEEQLANPFFKAFSDSEWKNFCNSRKLAKFHFYTKHHKEILNLRQYNTL